jgi:hypothetical protein
MPPESPSIMSIISKAFVTPTIHITLTRQDSQRIGIKLILISKQKTTIEAARNCNNNFGLKPRPFNFASSIKPSKHNIREPYSIPLKFLKVKIGGADFMSFYI